ncbi:hypothetical protein MASR2M29_18120 [Spirochaetota bacterium]
MLLTPNETELALLSGKKDIIEGTKVLLTKGNGAIIVTLGSKAAFL